MASPEKKRSPLIALEDWWTVWFGLVIILVATGFAMPDSHHQISAFEWTPGGGNRTGVLPHLIPD